MKNLKILISAVSLIFLGQIVFAQTFLISDEAIETCGGTLYDTGGSGGSYSNNETYTLLLCSDNGSEIELQFTSFNLGSGDILEIYNGAGTTNLLASGTGSSLNGQTIASDVNCLTLVWTSDGSTTGAGFAANISCSTLCQGFTTEVTATPENPVGGYLDICPGTEVDFTAVCDFFNNGSEGYTQTVASTTFHWQMLDQNNQLVIDESGQGMNTMSYNFTESAGYTLTLLAEDIEGCWNMGDATIRVRVSVPPTFSGTTLNPDPICPGEQVNFTGYVQTYPWEMSVIDTEIVEQCVDDGYEGTICFDVNTFAPGQTITSANDLESVCINMEHSYIGDFYMYIQCPNGQEAMLHEYYNCNGAYFGVPDQSDNCNPGTGWDYCWSMSGTQMVTDVCSSGSSVPAGTYLPLGTFNDLIGCPINGEWCIRFYDNWNADDGFIFTADLNFSPSILPQDTWGYENVYDTGGNSASGAWSGPDMNDDVGFIGSANPTVSGDINYTFTVIDDFGCEFDTSLTVTVLPITDPTCCIMPDVTAGPDDAVCDMSYNLDASDVTPGNSGVWTIVSGPPGAVFDDDTNPEATVSVDIYGTYTFAYTEYYLGNTANTACTDSDTIEITFNETFDPTITEIPDMCISEPTFQIYTADFGDLTVSPATTALDPNTGIFDMTDESLQPGIYTITNTIDGPCTGTGFDDESFEIFDVIEVVNFLEECGPTGSPTIFTVSWDVIGSQGDPYTGFEINGVPQAGSDFTEDHVSPGSYNYIVTDPYGCSEYPIIGYRDCGCPLFAGNMGSLETVVLCQNECTSPEVTHNGDEETDGGAGIFEFMIHNGNNVPIAYSNTPDFCFTDIPGGNYNTVYYVSAICGLPSGGHANLSGTCYSISQGTPVIWQQNPIAHAGSNRDTCGLVIRLDGNVPEAGMYGYWTSSCDFFPVGGTSHNDPDALVMANNYNTCTFTWNVANGECVASDDVTIGFLETPSPFAGLDITTCGNEATMAAVPSIPTSTLSWSGNGTTFTPQSSAEAITQVSNFGTYQYTVTEDNGACSGSATVLVTYIQGPSPTTTPNVDSVCGVTYNLDVFNVNGDGQWTAYEGGLPLVPAPQYLPSITEPSVEVTIPNYGGLFREIEFVWEETNQVQGVECIGTASKTVVFAKAPIASVGGGDESEICGNCKTFEADTTGSGWAFGSWIAKGVHGEWDDNSIPDATFCIDSLGNYGDTAHVRTPFIWVMRNHGCTSVDTAWVTFYQRPVANAGLDNAVCGKFGELGAVYDFPENSGYTPDGWWTTYSTPLPGIATADIANDEMDTTNVSVTHNGIYQFVFRENNSFLPMCYDTDTVKIEFVEIPVISAGEDKDVCGKTTTLEGVSGGYDGTWLANGSTYIPDYTDPNAEVLHPVYGDVTYTWLESNPATLTTLSCSSQDEVVITYWRVPSATIMTDDADTTVCGLLFDRLRAETPGSEITGYWYTDNPATDFYPNEFDIFPDSTIVPSYGYHDFYWIEETGPGLTAGFCNDTAGPLTIHFIEIPEANAGIDTLFCGYTGHLDAIPSVGTGVWSTPSAANITFEDINDPNTLITSSILNTGNPSNPYFQLIWTEDNNSGCTDKDTIKVVFARIPNSNMDIIPPKCFGELATIAAEEDSLQQYTWNFFTGAIDTTFINPAGGEYQNFVYWNSEDTLHRVSLIATNNWGCQSPINIDTVYEPPIPTFDVELFSDTCMLSKGAIIFGDTLENNSFFWLDTTVGPDAGTPITSVYELPVGEYLIKTSYLTDNDLYYAYYLSTFGSANCVDTLVYEIEPIGMIQALIEISATTDADLVAPEATVFFLNNSIYDNVGKRCEWHFGDETTEKNCDPQVEHIYTEAGCYEPFLIVMNRDLQECRDTAFLEECIQVDNASKIEVPNVFSPNGDGVNDFFQVKAQTLKTFKGIIVNRWGRTVYEWDDWTQLNYGWDGKLSGGTDAAVGVYYYVIKAVGMDDAEYDLQGPVHLVRD